jgi:hypothetical protein
MKKSWLPLTSVILAMLPAVLMFAHPRDGTTDKNTNGRQKIYARKGTKTTPKSTAGKVVGSADKVRSTRRIPDGDPDRPGKVLESPKSTDKAGTGRKIY